MAETRYESTDSGLGIGPVTTSTTIAAAGVGVLAWMLGRFAGIDIPPDVQGWLTVLAVGAAGFFTPGRGRRRAGDAGA